MTRIPVPPALRTALALCLAAPLWLVACQEAPEPDEDGRPANVTVAKGEADARRVAAAASQAVPAMPSAPANLAIAPTDAAVVDQRTQLVPDAMKGEKGARAVLLDWARALEQGDWARARAQWGHGGGDSGLSPEEFARSYGKYREISIAIGDGEVDGAAGSLYYAVPVTMTGTLRDGRVATLKGPVTLRRVNDVDGASAEDLRWHITQSALKLRP